MLEDITLYADFPSVRRKLNRRGLYVNVAYGAIWEYHIINPHTNSRVVVGPGEYMDYELEAGKIIQVAIYPHKVFEIATPADWRNMTKPIPVKY